MPRINLLPWRAEERKRRKVEFTIALGGAAVAAAVVAFAVYLLMGSAIDAQELRNQRLQAEIKELDKQIEEINDLEQQKQKFIARMEIIEKLQRSRPEVVRLFDEVVRTLPDGTYLVALTQKERRLKLEGVAQSSTRVSAFMRNIDASQWLKDPELEVVETKKDQVLGSNFTMFANQVSSEPVEDQTGAQQQTRRAQRGTSQ
jgi:type IV pilus assembly protein PilN